MATNFQGYQSTDEEGSGSWYGGPEDEEMPDEPSGGYDFFQDSNYYAPGGFDDEPPPQPQGNVAPGLPGSEYNVGGGATYGSPRVPTNPYGSGGVGGGGSDDSWIGGGTQTSSSATRPVFPTLTPYEVPDMGPAPTFEGPEWDENKIKKYTQRNLAAPLRGLREAYQMVASRLPSNPQSRQTLKEALGAYGSGLEKAVAASGQAASAEYGREYGYEFRGEERSYQAELAKYEADYKAQTDAARYNADIQNKTTMGQYSSDYADYLRSA